MVAMPHYAAISSCEHCNMNSTVCAPATKPVELTGMGSPGTFQQKVERGGRDICIYTTYG